MVSPETHDFDREDVVAAIVELGIGRSRPFCDGEFDGGECRIFKLVYDDRSSVAVRVRHRTDDSSQDDTIAIIQTEVRLLQTLEAKGFHWAPTYRGASLTFENPIQHPFIVLTWVNGSPLTWDEYFPPPALRDTLLCQIASIQLSLITITMETRDTTARSFFQRRIQNRCTRVQEGKIPGLSKQDCLKQQLLLDQVLGEDGTCTLFAMNHGDIKSGNIIVDEKYNIKGVIDWGFAEMVPIAEAALFPRFLWPDSSARFPPSSTVLKDRQAYIDSFSSEKSEAASFMLRWQNTKHVDFRTLYLESTSSKGIHISLARAGWKLS